MIGFEFEWEERILASAPDLPKDWMKQLFQRVGLLLKHKYFAPLLVAATLFGLIQHMRHFERWAWLYENYVQERTPNKEDDSDYAILAEHFWRLPHDKGLSVASDAWRETLAFYPFRSIAHGTVQLVLRHFFQDGWRLYYVYFAAFLEFLGILSLATGVAVFFRSVWLFPFVAHFFVKFSPFLDVLTLRVTEGLLRGAIPLAAGLFLLAAGLMIRGENRLKVIFSWVAYFFAALFVTTLKVQWWLGFAAFFPIFFLLRKTRAISYCAAAVAAGV